MPNPRSIRESDKASKELKAAQEKWPRVEEAWIGISWRLARGPNLGAVAVSEGGDYIAKFPSVEDYTQVPEITVLYRFDDSFVDVTSLRFVTYVA